MNQLKVLMILGPSIAISQTLVPSEAKLFASKPPNSRGPRHLPGIAAADSAADVLNNGWP